MVFDRVEDFLEFYKRYVVYVGITICSGPTGKNKSGKFGNGLCALKKDFYNLQRPQKLLLLPPKLCVRAKNVLFLRYFYTRFMLVIIVIFGFLFDFILFCRF